MRSVAMALALLGLGLASHAHAQPPPAAHNRADALFEEAKALMAKSRFLEACPKLVEARELDPGAAGTLLALALCHEGEGKVATALAEFRESLRIAVSANKADRQRLAREHIAALEKQVSTVTIVRAERAATVTLDNRVVAGDAPLEVDGGEHVVRAEMQGRKTWEERISVATRDDRRSVSVPSLEADVAATPGPQVGDGRSSTPVTAYVVGGVGVAAIVTGAIFGVEALSVHAESRKHCTGDACNKQGYDLNEDAKRNALASDIFIGAGVVGVGVAAALFLVGSKPRAPRPAALAVSVDPRRQSLSVSGSF